ncbi:Cys-tRNA(Pro)/Cys-tRNA(Cys) deacylase ybaK [[Eubacterium] siraeum]|uniref:Cys-tRNA(Pro)/Cys-tRNA(Cys) deacylase ybaK n=1 Tax=[Eubacterium] siraeum TaxID=39492 RepID=A0A174ZKF5_9FIRM|nr:Cys-tRNA(Pro)/Cys-tRNA(Cys) deacylase ybaK [[Eubacterium] siraeum]
MAKEKENKTNAMRILDKNKINYEVNTYECDEFIDGVHIADMLGQPYESSFKTLVTEGKSKNYYVFAIPIALELDMKKAAKAIGEKSIEMVHVKDINAVTGYIRGGCTPIGMKKQYKTVYHSTIKDFDKVIVSGGKLGTDYPCSRRSYKGHKGGCVRYCKRLIYRLKHGGFSPCFFISL